MFQFLLNARHRLRPYWQIILAMETINPCAPYRASCQAWEGVRDLCTRVGMSPEEGVAVVRQLKIQKDRAGDWSLAQVKACTNNLLRFYHSRLASDKQVVRQPDFPLANKFATIIFSLHLASSIIETYFSKTRYAKNKHRSRLSDDLASATLHIQQLQSYQDAETLESSSLP